MSNNKRTMRRLGAAALLALWFPVATANAVTCVLACSFADQHQTMAGMHHDDGNGHHGQSHTNHHSGNSASDGSNCGLSQIMALSFVEPASPTVEFTRAVEFAAQLPVFTPNTSFHLAYEPPPPRA